MCGVKRSVLAPLTLTGALLLSGCAGLTADEAASIDGRTIQESELQEAADQLGTLTGQPVAPAQVIRDLVLAYFYADFVDETGLELTDQQVSEALFEAGVTEPNEIMIDVFRVRQYQSALSAEGAAEDPAVAEVVSRIQAVTPAELQDVDIEISPRYGTWDPAALSVVDEAPAWIVPAG